MGQYWWYWAILSINTFGLIFIDVIDPSIKDFLFFIDSIDNQSEKPSVTDGHRSIGTHWIDSIDQLINLFKKFAKFLPFFALVTKKRPTSSKNLF
jgi:hypothetical protein